MYPFNRVLKPGSFHWMLLGFTLWTCTFPSTYAQETNAARYGQLLVSCLAEAPDTARAFRLSAPVGMPYTRHVLVNAWTQTGITVFLPDTTAHLDRPLPSLSYSIADARLRYEKAPGKTIRRTLSLTVHYTLQSVQGQILKDEECTRTATDLVDPSVIGSLESEAYPETRAPLPESGWIRRYVEPALLTAATAIGVYLFFSIRSERSNAE